MLPDCGKVGSIYPIFMTRHWKKMVLALLAIGVVGTILFVASQGFGQEQPEEQVEETFTHQVKTMTVEPGLNDTFTMTGEAVVGQRTNITSERRATVQDIRVKTGDIVTKDQILMVLFSESLDSSYLNTQLLFANAQANMSTTQAVANNQIESERLRYETAELQLSNTLAQNAVQRQQSEEALKSASLNSDLSVAQAETALETAQKNLNQTKALNASNLLVAETGLNNAVRTLRTSMFTGLTTANELLEVSQEFRGSAGRYVDLIGRLGQDAKREAEESLETAIDAYLVVEEHYDSMRDAAQKAEDALDKTLVALNLTVPTGDLNEQVVSSYTSSLSQSLSSVRGGLAGLESAQSSYLTAQASASANLTAAQQQVESAQKALDLAKQDAGGTSQSVINAEAQHQLILAQLATAETNARKAVESARLAYDNAKRNADLQILSARNAMLSSQDALDQLNISRDNLIVRSTFGGVINDVPVSLGDEVNAGTVLVRVDNPETIELEVFVSEADKSRIQVGDRVNLGTTMGSVTAVSQSADAVTKKYKIEIDPDTDVFDPGQFVRAEFQTVIPAQEDQMFLPISAILISNNETFVWTVEDGKTKKLPVILGDIQGDHVEVTEGIEPGTDIIIEGGRIIEDEGTEVEIVA
ncbi:HlyD family efflux transporter periplasmic adaptor subunit [Candidatus Uhrbacteria bacterium]|nr:HlyD family efflux transporter periplasmic adaptor subunit [Candidatus Uhrbacteria bacterium]